MIVISNTLYYHWVLLFALLQQSRTSFFLSSATHYPLCPLNSHPQNPKNPNGFVELKPQIKFLLSCGIKVGENAEMLSQTPE